MADRKALRRVGLSFGALTVAVTVIAATVVKRHVESQPTVDLAGSPAVEVVVKR